jgi:hypothetical protein
MLARRFFLAAPLPLALACGESRPTEPVTPTLKLVIDTRSNIHVPNLT